MAEVTLEEVPRKVREMYEKAFGAMERGNMDYAMDLFSSVLDLEPGLLKARKLLLAAALKKKGKGNQLTHLVSSVSGLGGLMGASSGIKKDPLKAVKAAQKLLRTDPLNPSFINVFEKAALAAELPEAAMLVLEIAKDHNPKDADLVDRLGRLYQELGQMHKARECFETLVALRPKDQKALKALKDSAALDTMQSGGWEGADSYRDIMKDSKEASLLEQAGKSVRAATGADALIEETLKKIQSDPENINYRRALADLYTKSHRYEEAMATMQEALAIAGGTDPEMERSLSATRVKEFEHRIAAARTAGDEAGAVALEAEKQTFLYEDALARVKKYPNDLQFKYDLGVLHFERGEINEAIQQLQSAQRNPQRRIRSLYYLALCFKSKEQFDIAAEQLEKAASELPILDDTKKDILYELGQVSEGSGDLEKATAYYKEIYAVDIGYKDVAQKIEQGYGS